MSKMCMNVPFLAYLEQFLLFICVLTAFQESFLSEWFSLRLAKKEKKGRLLGALIVSLRGHPVFPAVK